MAKKAASRVEPSVPEFAIGDRVEVKHFAPGVIIELRGPLGPNGAQVYRVLFRRKPRPAYLEVLGGQLKLLKPAKPLPPAADDPPAVG